MAVRELLTKWGFQIENEKLDRTEKQLEGIKSRLEVLAAAEIIRGVVELTERFSHFAEELHVAASSAGITVEAFQKLSFAASQSAVSQEEMEHSMTRLTRNLYEARKGGAEAQKVFADAGFSQEQITGFRTGNDVLLALADKFKGISDPIKKQALAMELMGRGSIHMVGFLSQGSAAIKGLGNEAEHLGIVLSGKQVEALVSFEHAMNKIVAVFKSLGAIIASYFAPSLEAAIKEFLKFYEVNRKLIDINIRTWVWDVTYAMGAVWAVIKFVTEAFINLAKALHIDKYIGTAIFAFGAYVATLFAVQKAMGVAAGGINLLKWSMTPLIGALKIVRGLVSGLVTLLFRFLGSETAAAAGAAVLEAPLWLIAAVVGVVIVAVHDLWKVLHGGKFEDTWVGQMVHWVKSFQSLGQVIDWLSSKFDLLKGSTVLGNIASVAGSLVDKFTGPGAKNTKGAIEKVFTGFGNVQALNNVENISNAPGGGGGEGSTLNQNYSVNAPITITAPSGVDHKVVAEKIKSGVQEHLDRVYREAQRALRPGKAY